MWEMKEQHDLRRQILEDVLGDNVEQYEKFNKEEAESKRLHRQRIPLWRFLLHLLNRDETRKYIEWNEDYELEFRIKDTIGVAELWGSVKNKSDMTYEKLGRAMRYYYGKNIIEKVSGRRYSYRFILSRRTKKYLAQYVNVSNMKVVSMKDSDHENDGMLSEENEIECTRKNTKKARKTIYITKQENGKDELTTVMKHQPSTKTKIFRPNESILQNIPSSIPSPQIVNPPIVAETKNTTILYRDDTKHISAFIPPIKTIKNKETEHNASAERLHAFPSTFYNSDRHETNYHLKKRSYPFPMEHKAIAYCCCGSHNCKVKVIDYSSDDNDSLNSHGSISPQNNNIPPLMLGRLPKPYYDFYQPSKTFFINRDDTEQEETEIFKLKKTLDKKFDPFMGYNGSFRAIDELFTDTNYFRSKTS